MLDQWVSRYFSPVCKSITLIMFRYQDALLLWPELSCQMRTYSKGPRGDSVLMTKFLTLPDWNSYSRTWTLVSHDHGYFFFLFVKVSKISFFLAGGCFLLSRAQRARRWIKRNTLSWTNSTFSDVPIPIHRAVQVHVRCTFLRCDELLHHTLCPTVFL